MRALRSTMYPPPGVGQPMTTVVRESDVKYPLDEVERIQQTGDPSVFVVTEQFSVPDGASIRATTLEANRRWQSKHQSEEHMAMLFYWTAMTIAKGKREQEQRGSSRPLLIQQDAGAPLTADELSYALTMLARHPAYTPDVYVETHSLKDGTRVVLGNGVVSAEPRFAPPTGGRGRYSGSN